VGPGPKRLSGDADLRRFSGDWRRPIFDVITKNFKISFSPKNIVSHPCKLGMPKSLPICLKTLLLIPFDQDLIKPTLLCINTFACLKINWYFNWTFCQLLSEKMIQGEMVNLQKVN
jgi:hypothetical protein